MYPELLETHPATVVLCNWEVLGPLRCVIALINNTDERILGDKVLGLSGSLANNAGVHIDVGRNIYALLLLLRVNSLELLLKLPSLSILDPVEVSEHLLRLPIVTNVKDEVDLLVS